MEITTTRRKEYMKEYREQNKEQISEYQKALYAKPTGRNDYSAHTVTLLYRGVI